MKLLKYSDWGSYLFDKYECNTKALLFIKRLMLVYSWNARLANWTRWFPQRTIKLNWEQM